MQLCVTNFKYLLLFKYFHIVGNSTFFIRFVQLQGVLFIYCYCFSIVEHAHVLKNVFQKPCFFIEVITNENVFVLMSQFQSISALKSCFSFMAYMRVWLRDKTDSLPHFHYTFFLNVFWPHLQMFMFAHLTYIYELSP